MKLRKGKSKEATENLVASLEEEAVDRERELEQLKNEIRFLRKKLEEEERR